MPDKLHQSPIPDPQGDSSMIYIANKETGFQRNSASKSFELDFYSSFIQLALLLRGHVLYVGRLRVSKGDDISLMQ